MFGTLKFAQTVRVKHRAKKKAFYNDVKNYEFNPILSIQSNLDVSPILQGLFAGALRAERGPRASSNMTDFRFYELQNKRRKFRIFVRIMYDVIPPPKEKVFTEILTFFLVEIR